MCIHKPIWRQTWTQRVYDLRVTEKYLSLTSVYEHQTTTDYVCLNLWMVRFSRDQYKLEINLLVKCVEFHSRFLEWIVLWFLTVYHLPKRIIKLLTFDQTNCLSDTQTDRRHNFTIIIWQGIYPPNTSIHIHECKKELITLRLQYFQLNTYFSFCVWGIRGVEI